MPELPEFAFTRRRALVAAAALAAALVVGGRLLAHAGATSPAVPAPLTGAPVGAGAPAAAPAAASHEVVVDVVGAVRRPGLYRLREGDRIADALARAGGATRKAQLAAVNLAAPLADGQQVVVPARGASGTSSIGAAGGPTAVGGVPSGPVQLSTATPEQLDALPGIGPVTAAKIVDYRTKHGPFHSVEELDAIPGIGPARIEQLRDLVVP